MSEISSNPPVAISAKPSKWLRPRRVPTWRIWLPALLIFGALAALLISKVHGWLAVTQRVDGAKYVVVEGWAPDYVIMGAEREFDDLDASMLFTTGLPLDTGSVLIELKNHANIAANTLAKSGMNPAKICPVAAQQTTTERTATMAQALKANLDAMNIPAADKKIQLVTFNTHARRSWKIFQKVLGPEWQVGIVSIPSINYEPANWFRSSEGAKGVIDELAALAVFSTGGN